MTSQVRSHELPSRFAVCGSFVSRCLAQDCSSQTARQRPPSRRPRCGCTTWSSCAAARHGRPRHAGSQKVSRAHRANIDRLTKEGLMVVAGPFEGTSGDRALAGIFILRVASMEAAKAAVDTDPAVKAGRFVYEIVPWWGPATPAILKADLKVGLYLVIPCCTPSAPSSRNSQTEMVTAATVRTHRHPGPRPRPVAVPAPSPHFAAAADLESPDLLTQAKAGDQAAFAALIRRHQNMVFSVALHMLRSRPAAEDLAQEVFLELYRSLGRLESDAHVVSWLRRVAEPPLHRRDPAAEPPPGVRHRYAARSRATRRRRATCLSPIGCRRWSPACRKTRAWWWCSGIRKRWTRRKSPSR